MNTVFIFGQIEDVGIELLKKAGFRVDVADTGSRISKEYIKQVFEKYDAVISMVSTKIAEEELKSASEKLKIIANYAVGFDNIDVLGANRKGIIVTNTPGVAGESVAEHTFALISACAKRIIEADRFVRQGKYSTWDPKAFLSPQIWGKTIGIVGLGRIGNYVGNIAFGGYKMKVLYHDVTRSEDFEMLTESTYVSLHNLLKESDFVTLHAPLTTHTHHLIAKEELKLMKKTAILINTARGAIIDETALIWALKAGEIAGAGLDVYEEENNIPHELRVLANVVLTPHIASATYETREKMSKIAAQNIIDVFAGRRPVGLVKVS